MPAAAQKETFQTLLSDTLADECSCEVVQAVHDQLCELVEEHRERKEAGALTSPKGGGQVRPQVLRRVRLPCGGVRPPL